jgi:type II secretory pathway pseudopilin PulG
VVWIQRRRMTFIEMVVVMAILSLVAGVIGVNISRSMQEQRFRTEVSQVMDKLRLAQNLMLILDEDIRVYFNKVEEGISCGLMFQCTQNAGWGKEINRPQLLTAVRRVDFKGVGEDLGKGDFALNFLSGGMVMSQGILKLTTGKNRLYSDRRYVCLPGFPASLVSVEKKPNLECLSNAKANEGLTQIIMPEIFAIFQPAPTSSDPVEAKTKEP